jgi:hypothetical protein
MAETRDSAADATVLNEHDAAMILLALSGSDKILTATNRQYLVVKEQLRINMMRNPPRRGGTCDVYWMQRGRLQAEKVALEAELVTIKAEGRFFASPKANSQYLGLLSEKFYP